METVNTLNALRVVYGNHFHQLANMLADELFAKESLPFEKRLIVVPSLALKDFLYREFAANPRLKIAAGVQVLLLHQTLAEIFSQAWYKSFPRKKLPSFAELTLVIEQWMYVFGCKQFPDLQRYLKGQEKRIAALSDELARLFARYGLYGEQFLSQWLLQEGWQQALWKFLFSKDSRWTYPLEAVQKMDTGPFEGKMAVFGFEYLPPAYLSFFSSLQASIYQLSPCALFWQDHMSNREQLSLQRTMHKKEVKEVIQEDVTGYLQKMHPLLGNWGKLGRKMLEALESFTVQEHEAYQDLSGNIPNVTENMDLGPNQSQIFSEVRDTLLLKLKTSLLNLDLELSLECDDSIQLHSAPSKLREVEVLKDVLQTLLYEKKQRGETLGPKDILVVSPEIEKYAPYIRMVFSSSPFSFSIEDLPLVHVSETLQCFFALLKLPQERYELAAMCKLLRCPPFMQKQGLSAEEIHQLEKWFKQAQIRRDLAGNTNSWEAGLDRLLYGLALHDPGEQILDPWPLPCIPQSEVDLFDRFLDLFSELKVDLAQLLEKKTCSEWLEFFLCLAEKYMVIEGEESFFKELKALIPKVTENLDLGPSQSPGAGRSQLARISNTSDVEIVPTAGAFAMGFGFESMQRILTFFAQKKTGELACAETQKIRFTSLQSGNVIPAKVIWCLGMQEEAFPRKQQRSSLCEMTRCKAREYFPQRVDEDRSHFLELFLHAEQSLIFSYQRTHEDGKQQAPSLLIEELNQYLKQQGCVSGVMTFHHPSLPFDQSYFSKTTKTKKWEMGDYRTARAYYFPHLEKAPFLSKGATRSKEEASVIDIRQLKKLARHPVQFFFNESLKIFLKDEQDAEENDFLLSYFDKFFLRHQSLEKNLSLLVERARAKGTLPVGVFQQAAVKELEEEARDLLKQLDAFGVEPQEVYRVQLSATCQEAEKKETILPALKIDLSSNKTVYLTGTLEGITSKGLLYYGDKDLKSLLKAWPLYLIYRCLGYEGPLLLSKEGLSLEFSFEDAQEMLANYLDYYLECLQRPSPLMPQWASWIAKEDFASLRKAFSKNLDDRYLDYLKRREEIDLLIDGMEKWDPYFSKLFSILMAPKEGGKEAP